jgi:hypothetical protein
MQSNAVPVIFGAVIAQRDAVRGPYASACRMQCRRNAEHNARCCTVGMLAARVDNSLSNAAVAASLLHACRSPSLLNRSDNDKSHPPHRAEAGSKRTAASTSRRFPASGPLPPSEKLRGSSPPLSLPADNNSR